MCSVSLACCYGNEESSVANAEGVALGVACKVIWDTAHGYEVSEQWQRSSYDARGGNERSFHGFVVIGWGTFDDVIQLLFRTLNRTV